MRIKALLLSVLLVFLIFKISVASDYIYDEEFLFMDIPIVRSVGFFQMETSRAPGYIQILSMDDVYKSPARTWADIFKYQLSGVAVGQHERQGTILGSRGILIDNNAKTLFMLDGQQLNRRMHFGYMIGLMSPFMLDIKTTEVIIGPGAIVHGSGAINGFVNFIPRSGSDSPGLMTRFEYVPEYNMMVGEFGYGHEYGFKKNTYFYYGQLKSPGHKPLDPYGIENQDTSPTQNVVRSDNANDFMDSNYRMALYWNHDAFSLNAFLQSLNPDTQSLADAGFWYEKTLGIGTKYDHIISEENNLEIHASGMWGDQGVYRDNALAYSEIQNNGGAERQLEAKLIYKTTAVENNDIAIGTLYGNKRFFNATKILGGDTDGEYESLNFSWNETSIFFEDIITISDSLKGSLGLRYDNVEYGDIKYVYFTGAKINETNIKPVSHATPRIALSYLMDKSTIINVSYQQGYRYPDANYYNAMTVINQGLIASGNTTQLKLKPETMDSYEISYEKEVDTKLKIHANLFYNIYKDQLVWNDFVEGWPPTPKTNDPYLTQGEIQTAIDSLQWNGWAGSFVNLKDTSYTYGGELIINYVVQKNVTLKSGYGLTQFKTDNDIRYPSHQWKNNIRTKWMDDKLVVDIDYVYSSPINKKYYTNLHKDYRKPSNIVNVALNYELNKDESIKVTAQNLFVDKRPMLTFKLDRPDLGNKGYIGRPLYTFSLTRRFR